jgi:hypothetical protein
MQPNDGISITKYKGVWLDYPGFMVTGVYTSTRLNAGSSDIIHCLYDSYYFLSIEIYNHRKVSWNIITINYLGYVTRH